MARARLACALGLLVAALCPRLAHGQGQFIAAVDISTEDQLVHALNDRWIDQVRRKEDSFPSSLACVSLVVRLPLWCL